MTSQQLREQLDARISRFDLLCHPFYHAWSAGQLTRDDLRQYASDYYHHVSAFPTYLSAFHARLEDGELRRAVLNNLYEEELDGTPHSELWLDFAEAFGNDRAMVKSREPLPEIKSLVQNFRRVAREGTRAEALAAFYAYESQVPRVAKEKARGLKEMYGCDAKGYGYFTLHTFADVRHSQVWREQLDAELAQHPEHTEAAMQSAEHAAQWLWQALDGIERRRTQAAVA